jgi:butyrate kinase
MKILVINPGSTSTKAAVYEDDRELSAMSVPADRNVPEGADPLYGQLDARANEVARFLAGTGYGINDMDVVVARGGILPPVKRGAYVINSHLCAITRWHPAQLHASNLGALIAERFARQAGIPAYIYDPVSVDEMTELAHYSGIKGRDRLSYSHALNTRAVALKHCGDKGLDPGQTTWICAHLGGGISLNIQQNGRLTDVCSAEEGPFSPERAGGLQVYICAAIVREEGADGLLAYESGKGGLYSYLGTSDTRAAEKMALDGDMAARTAFEAMAYQTSKVIGALAATAAGRVDGILLTGGMARIPLLTDGITRLTSWIAPVTLYPGEFEMQALAGGAYRVMTGQEQAAYLA